VCEEISQGPKCEISQVSSEFIVTIECDFPTFFNKPFEEIVEMSIEGPKAPYPIEYEFLTNSTPSVSLT